MNHPEMETLLAVEEATDWSASATVSHVVSCAECRASLEHIEQARRHGGVWLTTPGAICRHVEALGSPDAD